MGPSVPQPLRVARQSQHGSPRKGGPNGEAGKQPKTDDLGVGTPPKATSPILLDGWVNRSGLSGPILLPRSVLYMFGPGRWDRSPVVGLAAWPR